MTGDGEFDLVIRGGTVATATDVFAADVGIPGEQVAAIGRGLAAGPHEIDATGRLVLPGGVDSHCHIEQLTASGLMNADTFASATASAAIGGTTTVIPFAAQHVGTSLTRGGRGLSRGRPARCGGRLRLPHDPVRSAARGAGRGAAAAGARRPRLAQGVPDLRPAARRGRRSSSTCSTPRARHGQMVCVHAENHGMISWMGKRLLAGGYRAPRYHVPSHPRLGEVEAIGRAIACAALVDQPLMIFHVSTAEGPA